MKKIITVLLAVFLAMLIAVAPVGAVETDGTPNIFIEKLASFTPEMRAQYIAMVRPFLTTDAGIEAGISNVRSGLFEVMLGITFTPTQEDALIRIFKSLGCIKESTGIRLKYADIFQNKIPAEISEETKEGIEKLILAVGEKFPLIEKIIREDGYGAPEIANMLKAIPEINQEALLTFDNGEFYVRNVNSEFSCDIDEVWSGYAEKTGRNITAFGLAQSMTDVFNLVPEENRYIMADALEELEICVVEGDGTVPPVASANETEHYIVLEQSEGFSDSVFKNAVVIKTKQNIPDAIEILVESANPMIYKLTGADSLEPIKRSVPTENGLLAAVEAETVYVIKTAAYPFVDADGWGKNYIAALYARGIINGKSNTEFMPDAPITREEFIKLVVELFDLTDENAKCEFIDVSENAWYRKYVASAHQAGITEGIGNRRFGTGEYIKRQDMAKIINTILVSQGIELSGENVSFLDDGDIADYAKSHVYAISGHIISGDDAGNFNPLKNATRQEAAKMVFGMLKLCIS